jgi:hypothetical protein
MPKCLNKLEYKIPSFIFMKIQNSQWTLYRSYFKGISAN